MSVSSLRAGNQAEIVGSVAVLLRNLIDYAGLFPPAALAMANAVANYDSYSRSEYDWALGRFIVPVARLKEFAGAIGQLSRSGAGTRVHWQVSVLAGPDLSRDLVSIREFQNRSEPIHPQFSVVVSSVELKAASAVEIERQAASIPSELEAYFEISPGANLPDCIAAVGNCERRAKIRTGGETADKFPSGENVLEFIRLCAAAKVPFKATAGLHHPLRSRHRLTYQPDSPSGMMHGFLNVFVAAVFLHAGLEPSLALEMLNEQSERAFQFGSDEVIWRGKRVSVNEVDNARRSFALSFGSCSFTEPIDDLRSLHLL